MLSEQAFNGNQNTTAKHEHITTGKKENTMTPKTANYEHQTQAYPNGSGYLFQVLKEGVEVYGKTFETLNEYEEYCSFMGIKPKVVPAVDF